MMFQKFLRSFCSFLVSPCRFNLVWLPYALCVAGFVLMMLLFYPGIGGSGKALDLAQRRLGYIGDWHPPIFCLEWQLVGQGLTALTGKSIIGTGVIWTLDMVMIWGGILLCLRSSHFWKTKQPFYLILLAVFLLCWMFVDIFNDPRNLLKDTGFLGAYLMVAGLLLNFPKRLLPKLLIGLLVFCFLFYGTALRHNAVFAAFPLMFWLVWTFNFKRFHFVSLTAFVLWLAMLAGIHYINYNVIKAVRLYSIHEIFFLDIWHLNNQTEHYVVPPNVFGLDFSTLDEKTFRSNFRQDRLFIDSAFAPCRKFMPSGKNGRLVYDDAVISSFPETATAEIQKAYETLKPVLGNANKLPPSWISVIDPETAKNQFPKDYELLKKAWIERIKLDPVAYLKFKTKIFTKFCRDHNVWFAGLNPLFLMPILFFITATGLLSKNRKRPAVFPYLMLSLSALFYILPMGIFLPDNTQFRYLFWFFAASYLSIALFCANSPLFAEIMQTVQRYFTQIR